MLGTIRHYFSTAIASGIEFVAKLNNILRSHWRRGIKKLDIGAAVP